VKDKQCSEAHRLEDDQDVISNSKNDAYGQGISIPGPSQGSDPYGWNGRWGYYHDTETGLHYCQQRYYDAAAGRWITRDPIGYAGGMNLYGYCGGAPVGRIDPSGTTGFLPVAVAATHEESWSITISTVVANKEYPVGHAWIGVTDGLGSYWTYENLPGGNVKNEARVETDLVIWRRKGLGGPPIVPPPGSVPYDGLGSNCVTFARAVWAKNTGEWWPTAFSQGGPQITPGGLAQDITIENLFGARE
jgi:RHS repeat-associated protein